MYLAAYCSVRGTMKYLISAIFFVISFNSLALSCDSEIEKLNEEVQSQKNKNYIEIEKLAEVIVAKGKAKSVVGLVYKLQYDDPEVSKLNKQTQVLAVKFIELIKSKDCTAILAGYKSIGEADDKRSALMIKKLKAM
jgi:hypothetical protein